MTAAPPHSPPRDLTPTGAAQAFVRLSRGAEAAAPPVRAVQFGAERFAEHGRSLAAAQRVDDPRQHPRPFSPRLRSNLQVWGAALEVLSEEGLQADIDPAHAWLLDNARIVQQQLDEVLHDLPRSYFQRLPRLADEPLQGLPRIYGVAWAWVAHADSSLELPLLQHFLAGHHEVEPLTLRELWALPSTLRVVLVENLRRLAERAAWRHLARSAAQNLFEAMPQMDAAGVRAQLKQWQTSWPHDPALTALALRLRERLADRALGQPDQGDADDLAADSPWTAAHAWLADALPDPAAAQAAEQAESGADHQSIRNAIGSLRNLGAADWAGLFEAVHPTLRALGRIDVYRQEDETTRDMATHAIEALTERHGATEADVAQVLSRLCSDPAWPEDAEERAPLHWLRGPGHARLMAELQLKPTRGERLKALLQRHRVALYLASLAALLGITEIGLMVLGLPHEARWPMVVAAVLLSLLPASEAIVALANRLISESAAPDRLPRFTWPRGIPASSRTLVVIPCMLTGPKGIATLLAQLERHHLANLEQQTQFALLSDWTDAGAEHQPKDDGLLAKARAGIQALNQRHGTACDGRPRFLLLHRARRWSETEQRWIGWERKRGKTEALAALLAGEAQDRLPDHFLDLGELSTPAPGIRHLVTLDADTALPPGALREMVAIAAHPLNRPRLHRSSGGAVTVVRGHGMLQPRVATPLATAAGSSTVHGTWFHSLFAGQPGLDPYSAASSEVYQDLFDEGSASGKGLIDVRAAAEVLAHSLPEGQVLSHDLLEGSLMRCAGVSDVVLVEPAPMHADVAASRIHRWTRGDWQLLPFVARPQRWGLRAIHVWKMLDNLRRSLVAPAALVLLAASWVGVGLTPAYALGLVAAAFGAGPLMGALAACGPSGDRLSLPRFYRQAAIELARALGGVLWHVAMLPAASWLSLDAITRALWRQHVSRRHLLEWTTADAAEAAARTDWRSLLRQHRRLTLASGVLALLLMTPALVGRSVDWQVALPLLVAWALSPLWIGLASRPRTRPRREAIDDDDRQYLLSVARDTWRWFERWVTDDDHDLPPDNVQFDPDVVVAHRTSPTNVGLYLLSACCAREFGWLHDVGLAERIGRTLDTLDQLPRHRGHFYNWIDTRRLAVLDPPYISTVDSGNLCAHLLVVAAACEGFARGGEGMPPPPGVAQALNAVAERARAMALAHDFSWLYDPQRHLLHIGAVAGVGTEPGTERLDQNHYDLLASEARLASLVAIAKGDVPPAHWGALGRPFFSRGRVTGLKSWSGSMFEMLMPSLVLDEPTGSALADAARATVMEQIRAGKAAGLPWGVSESAYAKRDQSLAYQYGPQGVASLALRDTPPEELVIAPYATLMAAMVMPRAAVANLRALQALGARHAGGFIEALDYTVSRQPEAAADAPPGPRLQRIGTAMSHHQGMSLVALTEVLCGGAPQRWADAEPRLCAVRWLLHERAPHKVAPLREPPPKPTRTAPRRARTSLVVPELHGRALPATAWLGHGALSAMVREHGGGTLVWGEAGSQVLLSRWHDDLPQDLLGHHLHLRDLDLHWNGAAEASPWRSLTFKPTPGPQWRYGCRLHPASAQFTAEGEELDAHTEVWVAVEDEVELRRITLRNLAHRPRRIALVSSFEPVLAPAKADLAHPAFGKLFLQGRWSPDEQALYWQRQPRSPSELALHAVHALVGAELEGGARLERVRAGADRAHWLARGGMPGQPGGVIAHASAQALMGAQVPGLNTQAGALDTGNDPISLLHLVLTLPPGARVTLTVATAAAREPQTLQHLLDKLRQPALCERALTLAHTMAAVRTQGASLAPGAWRAGLTLQTLLTSQAPREHLPLPETGFERDALWRHGISGDDPIVLIRVVDTTGVVMVRELCALLQAQGSPLPVDVVVLDAEPPSYLAPVSRALRSLGEQQTLGRSRVHVLSDAAVGPDTRFALNLLARVRWFADGRPLAQQLERLGQGQEQSAKARRAAGATLVTTVPAPPGVTTPRSRFDPINGACSFDVSERAQPERPWINVIANEHFGCHVSERGAGMAWAGNSRLHQITPWSNDPLLDSPGEWLMLHCLASGKAWLLGRASARQHVAHLPGATAMTFQLPGMVVRLRWTVDAATAVRQCQVELHAAPGRAPRPMRLLAAAQWQLGSDSGARRSVVTRLEAPQGEGPRLALATQTDGLNGFGGHTAWMALRPVRPGDATAEQIELLAEDQALWPWPEDAGFTPDLNVPHPWTAAVEASGDRRLLFDDEGRLVMPHALDGLAGPGTDPAALLAVPLRLEPGHAWHATVLLGHAPSLQAAREQAVTAWAADPLRRLADQRLVWRRLSAPVQVDTPDPAFDALVNHWLPAQVLGCRIWARAGFYQAGGAFGFRDQLQDAMALVQHAPELLAAQIRRHAARQFAPGDVQHWWHEPAGAGVRTHFADDRLWLALALALYVERTGDTSLADEPLPFLQGRPIPEGQEDVYEVPAISDETAPIYEHAARAIDVSLPVGGHGLPLFGTGDWNDGMNRVGAEGRGESVWMGFFLCAVIDALRPLALARGESARAGRWLVARQALAVALDAQAWDGRWYRRGWFDDGCLLGTHTDSECRIDLIVQAWAVLTGATRPERAREALDSLWRELHDRDAHLLRLLWPPLHHHQPPAGYIQAYPGGVRENGGQYNHGAVWALMASAHLGQAERAWSAFTAISPAHRGPHGAAYGLEPYAVAGDLEAAAPHAGRGGWSWYTGAAGWLLRAAVESICGVRLADGQLRVLPCLPLHWLQARVQLLLQDRRVQVLVQRAPAGAGTAPPPGYRTLAAGTVLTLADSQGELLLWVPVTDTAPAPRAEAAMAML